MAVAAPKRRTAPAPPPARTTPPKRKAAPKRNAAAAPARVPTHRPTRKAPARAPQRAKPKTRRSHGARVIPLAGRTAVAVSQLPDSGLIVRMTRSRVWIGVLGVLLVGIVALNVVNLSFSASAAKIDAQIGVLESEIGVLKGRDATRSSTERVRYAGRELGLVQPAAVETEIIEFNRETIQTAAGRLAAISP
jgi:hypothetical protein